MSEAEALESPSGQAASAMPGRVRLMLVGDLALGDHPKAVGTGFYSRYRHGIPASRSQRLLPADLAFDIAIGNLEFPLGSHVSEASVDARMCRGLEEYAASLASAGFTLLNVANNHLYQHGAAAFERTLAALRRAGIRSIGTPRDFDADSTIDVNGMRVRALGWSSRPRQYRLERPPYNEFSEARCLDEIRRARTSADAVIVSMHWGEEFIQVPADEERGLARRMIDAGASVVFGHHPHVLREIEEYRDGIVAYSLGNFVCDMTWDRATRETGCLHVNLEGPGVAAWDFRPAVIGNDFWPRYLSGPEAEAFTRRLTARFSSQSVDVEMNGYGPVAERHRRRHRRKLLWGFMRQAFRNRPGTTARTAWSMVRDRPGREGARKVA